MDEFADRLFDLGWDRTKAVWAVPQAFGDDTKVLWFTSCRSLVVLIDVLMADIGSEYRRAKNSLSKAF